MKVDARGKIVAGADAREDAVDQPDLALDAGTKLPSAPSKRSTRPGECNRLSRMFGPVMIASPHPFTVEIVSLGTNFSRPEF